MKVRVLLFAQYKDAAGAGELDLDVPAGSSALDVISRFRADLDVARIPERPVIAVNQVFTVLDHVLRDGDELALLPPVAGG